MKISGTVVELVMNSFTIVIISSILRIHIRYSFNKLRSYCHPRNNDFYLCAHAAVIDNKVCHPRNTQITKFVIHETMISSHVHLDNKACHPRNNDFYPCAYAVVIDNKVCHPRNNDFSVGAELHVRVAPPKFLNFFFYYIEIFNILIISP